MHEITLAIQAVKTVLEFAEDSGIERIDTVVLEIGELSMVVPQYMEAAWAAVIPGTALEGSRLRIDLLPGNGICTDCAQVYNIVEHQGVCPRCGGKSKDILCGQGFNVKEILVPE